MIAASGIAIGLIIGTSLPEERGGVPRPASFSFGVLLAFTAAQLAVIKLRVTQPELRRPFRVPLGIRAQRGATVPLPAVLGTLATLAVFVAAMAKETHIGARYGGPAWLLGGIVVYTLVRRSRGAGLLEHVVAAGEQELPRRPSSPGSSCR